MRQRTSDPERRAWTRWTTATVILTITLLTGPWVASSIAQTPSDDWVVLGPEIRDGGEIELDGDLIVAPGGHLILQDVTLLVAHGASIIVLPGGNLTVLDSEVDVQPGQDPGWDFQVLGSLHIDGSTVAHATSIEVRGLAHITDSTIEENVDHGVHTVRKGVSTIVGTTFVRNALDASAATAGGIVATDATVFAEDNVLIGNGGFGIRIVSTLAGARVFGPAVATLEHNVVAHHASLWAIHFQEYYNTIHRVERNLVYGNIVGINVQSTNDQMATQAAGLGSMFAQNALVNNTFAAVNHGFVGSRDQLDETLDPTADLADSWVPRDHPDWERANELGGPWETGDLIETNPVPELWDTLEEAEAATGISSRDDV